MKVFWTSAAEQDRADILDFIGRDKPLAAIGMDERFGDAAGRLSAHPLLGRAGRVAGTRELVVHTSYILVYDVIADSVRVLRVLHAARQWPPQRT